MGGGWCVGMAPCGQVRFSVVMRGIQRGLAAAVFAQALMRAPCGGVPVLMWVGWRLHVHGWFQLDWCLGGYFCVRAVINVWVVEVGELTGGKGSCVAC